MEIGMKKEILTALSFAAFISGCGGDDSSGPVNPKFSGQYKPEEIRAVYLRGAEKYPRNLRDAIGGDLMNDTSSANLIVVPADASPTEADLASQATAADKVVLIYSQSVAPSEYLTRKFIAISSGYASVIPQKNSENIYVYGENQTNLIGEDVRKFINQRAKILATQKSIVVPQITESTINGQKLRQWTETFNYKVSTDDTHDSNIFADISLKLTGTKNLSAVSGADQSYWTASIQGAGFSGKSLLKELYEPGKGGDRNVSQWTVTLPFDYIIKLKVGKGTSLQAPIVDGYAPNNQLISSNQTVSTGWNVGAKLSASTDGKVGGEANAGFTNTESRTMEIKDATLTAGVDLSSQEFSWLLHYNAFTGPSGNYKFSDYGAYSFLSHNLSGYDSNMLLNKLSDISPTMQAYAPMYNVLYEVSDGHKKSNHTLDLSIGMTQWKFKVRRILADWSAPRRPPNCFPYDAKEIDCSFQESNTNRITVLNSF